MLVNIVCPTCRTEGSTFFTESSYQGPYRCWKSSATFYVEIKDSELISCEPLSEEDLRKQQEAKAIRDKLKRQFPGRE